MGALNYYFQVYKWPSSLLKLLDSSIRNFLWSGDLDYRKKIVVSLKKACFSKQDHGLCLRDLSLQNQALLKKLACRVLTEDSFVFCFLRSRFFRERYEPKSYWFTSPIWGGIKSNAFGLLEESIWMVIIQSYDFGSITSLVFL